MTIQFAIVLLFLCCANFSGGQNASVKLIVEKTDNLELDMFELVDFANENLKSERELAQFFYYWIGKNISYDHELLQNMDNGLVTNEVFWESQATHQVYPLKPRNNLAGFPHHFSRVSV